MASKAELEEKIEELEGKLNGIREALGATETEEILQDVKEALEEGGFELPESDEELADAIREYDFTTEEEE